MKFNVHVHLQASDTSNCSTSDYRHELYRILFGLPLAKWELVGPHLGLRQAQLDMIKMDNHGRSDPTQHCVAAMFRKWLDMDDSFTSYEGGLEKIITALHAIGESTIANDLSKNDGKFDKTSQY